MMFFIWVFFMVFTIENHALKNVFNDDPFCFGRLIGQSLTQRSFQFSVGCDLEPIDRPYKIFPPSLLLIGAQKAGTTALTWLFRENTEMDIGYKKEIKFLSYRPDFFRLMHSQNLSYLEYQSLFVNATGPTVDGSPGYHAFGGFICQNLMYTLDVGFFRIPKMAFILRDPLSRLYSHYKMRKRWSTLVGHRLYTTTVPSLESLIEDELKKLSRCGLDINLRDPKFDPHVFYGGMQMWCYHEFVIERTDMYLVKGLYA